MLDFLCILQYNFGVAKSGVNRVADKKKLGRPVSENPKNIQMRIRLTEKENIMLNECANLLNTTKSNVLITGLQKVYAEVKK